MMKEEKKVAFVEKDKEKENIIIDVNNSSKNQQNELLLSKQKESTTANSSFEIVDINFSICIDFYLTTDPLMAFLKYRKEGLYPVIHLLSSDITEDAYVRDTTYIDFQLRSNLLYLLNSSGKSIKYPVAFNGNVYLQYLFFLRNSK